MGKSGGSTQTTTNTPPAYATPTHQSALGLANTIANTPYSPYPYAQIANFTPEQQTGMDMTVNRAMSGSPVGNAAQAEATKTLQGEYLNPQNPAYQNALDYGQRQVMKNYGAQLGRNFGNSGVNQEVGEGMGNVSGALYDAERNRMTQQASLAPSLANMDYTDLQAMLGVGDVKQGFNQQQLDLSRNEYQTALNWPSNRMGTLLNAVQGTGGYGTTTAPNPYQSSRAAGAIGGAAAGTAVAPGWGTLIGAVAGGLLS